MTQHLILGAGPAGVIAAETIRKHAPDDRITLVGDEPEPPYSRMAIPYLLRGSIGEAGTYLRKGTAHYQDLGIKRLQGRVESIDIATKNVVLADHSRLSYDTLLIATGSHPVRAPIPGIDADGVHPCWTLADARAIMARAQAGARVLQLGAGFIGCIIMEALMARGVHLTVVEMGDRMVPRMMGPTAGGMIRDWCGAKGVQVFTGTRVESISPGAPLQVRLSNGQTLAADLLINAAGVRPAIAFLKDSGITCLQGVLTDEYLQTHVPGVYAAGDCAEAFDKVSGKTVVSAIQPNAAEQARVAARNMVAFARGEPPATALKGVTQINVLDTLGLVSSSFGDWAAGGAGERFEWTDHASGRHLRLQFDGERLVGCNTVGWTEHLGVLRALVEDQIPLGVWKQRLQQYPTQLVPAYLACAQGQGAWSAAGDGRRR